MYTNPNPNLTPQCRARKYEISSLYTDWRMDKNMDRRADPRIPLKTFVFQGYTHLITLITLQLYMGKPLFLHTTSMGESNTIVSAYTLYRHLQ